MKKESDRKFGMAFSEPQPSTGKVDFFSLSTLHGACPSDQRCSARCTALRSMSFSSKLFGCVEMTRAKFQKISATDARLLSLKYVVF